MNYQQKLSNPAWQKKRLHIFERDKWQCRSCGATEKELHVHHVDYLPDIQPYDYPDDMLKTLCHDCHEKENDRPKHEKYLLHSMKMKGFFASDILCLSTMIDRSQMFVESIKIIIRKEQRL